LWRRLQRARSAAGVVDEAATGEEGVVGGARRRRRTRWAVACDGEPTATGSIWEWMWRIRGGEIKRKNKKKKEK
jgi:hypothetical protein